MGFFHTLFGDQMRRSAEIEALASQHNIKVLVLHNCVELPANSPFFKKQSRLVSQRCTIFYGDEDPFAKFDASHAKKNLFLLTTNLSDEVVCYRVQLPRRIRDAERGLQCVNAGPFCPNTFFDTFYEALLTEPPSQLAGAIPIFSDLTWQDCLLVLEMFVVSQYFLLAQNAKTAKGGGRHEALVKTVDMSKSSVPLTDEASYERDRTNLLTSYNTHLLTFYHLWYLYHHHRTESFGHSWQPQLL